MVARPVRLNNPGDLERVAGVTWQGEADAQLDSRFVTFKTPQWGFRALARTLLTYQNTHGLKTVGQIISRFAPPSDENPTADYAKLVADECGVRVNDEIVVDAVAVMLPMCRAIAREESGLWAPWPDSLITEGLHMAGVADAKPKPLVKQGGFATQVGAGVSVVGAGIISTVKDAAQDPAKAADGLKGIARTLQDYSAVPLFGHIITILLTVAGGLALLGVVGMALKQKVS